MSGNNAKNSGLLLEELLNVKSETQNLDFKERFNWLKASKTEKIGLIKDVLSMTNVKDGGKIVVGVEDKQYDPVGLSEEDYSSFDTTSFNQFLHKYTDPPLSCVVHKVARDGKFFVVIDIPEFSEVPILSKESAGDESGKEILHKGQIYYRTEKASSEVISSTEEMRELLGRALLKKKQALLHSIETILEGRSTSQQPTTALYNAQIEEALNEINGTVGKQLEQVGSWTVVGHPKHFEGQRIQDQPTVRKLIQQAEVALRGWSFPHTDKHGNTVNTLDGVQSHSIGLGHIEGYRAYKSGLFIWRANLWKEVSSSAGEDKTASFIALIYHLTEMILFFSRFYNSFDTGEEIEIKITLDGLKGRKLVSSDPFVDMFDDHISGINVFRWKDVISISKLVSSYREIAAEIVLKLFHIFNLEDMAPETVASWQNKLLKREF